MKLRPQCKRTSQKNLQGVYTSSSAPSTKIINESLKIYTPIHAKSILRKYKFMDDWFLSKYGMNLYRGCEHACGYCDGRAEKYRVSGDFGKEVSVKINAISILKRELTKIKEKTIIFVGGGVGDSYQPAETKFKLTERTLKLLKEYDFPCHLLTKSSLIERDIDLIKKINEQNRAITSFSISSLDENIWSIFEPAASPPLQRMESLTKFSKAGVATGVMFVPFLPFLSDDEKSIENVVKASKEAGADFLLFGGLTLKEGRQKEHFMKILKHKFPDLIDKYHALYKDSGEWGNADQEYYKKINRLAYDVCLKHDMPTRIPHETFKGKMELKYEIAMILAHIAYFLEMRGEHKRAYRIASRNIQKVASITVLARENRLTEIIGVGPKIAKMIEEIIHTGRCSYYEKLRQK